LACSRIAELEFLGNTELVLSNHEDAVPANCVEGTPIKSFLYLPSSSKPFQTAAA
jgi:hypothetical protein